MIWGLSVLGLPGRQMRMPWRLAAFAIILTLSPTVRAADSPSLQELLGRAQTQTERKAVEDLVDKLQGGARKPTPTAPTPAPTSAPPPSTAPPVTAAPA